MRKGYRMIERLKTTDEIRNQWRLLVKQRDNYICGRCNKQLSRLPRCGAHAHHIIPRAEGGVDTIDNGVTVCISCHQNIHQNLLKGKGYFEALKG